jgi:hypothetical protein
METKLDNSKDQSQDAVKPVIKAEYSVAEPIVVGKAKEKEVPNDDELDLELELDDESDDEEDESDDEPETVADEVEPDEKPEPTVKLSKEQRKIQALKNEAKKLQLEKAELQKKLDSKKDSGKEEELAKQYIDEGEDETTARKKAKADIRQTNLEKQVETLLFEKTNRKVLAKYPQSDNDLERIISASKTGVMTVEEICRGLYGNDLSPKDKRAISALVDDDKTEASNSVAKATRSAVQPTRSKLTPDQLEIKRFLEKRFGKKISDEDAIKYSES